VMKNFFSEGKGLKIRFEPIFYRLLECIFYGESLDEGTVVTALIDPIRIAFKNDGDDYHTPFHTTVYQAIATRTMLGRLGLFNHPNYSNMENNTITLRREQYLEEHAGFFKDQPALKGAFLLGLLTSMLTYAQYDHLKSKPFLNKLNNLNMGLEELRALVPQLLNKIQQYQNRKSGYAPSHKEVTEIAAEASSLLMKGGRPSRDDLSFAFATGLVMQNKFGQDIADEKKAEKGAAQTAE
jgi:CRISPR-associated protein Csh1